MNFNSIYNKNQRDYNTRYSDMDYESNQIDYSQINHIIEQENMRLSSFQENLYRQNLNGENYPFQYENKLYNESEIIHHENAYHSPYYDINNLNRNTNYNSVSYYNLGDGNATSKCNKPKNLYHNNHSLDRYSNTLHPFELNNKSELTSITHEFPCNKMDYMNNICESDVNINRHLDINNTQCQLDITPMFNETLNLYEDLMAFPYTSENTYNTSGSNESNTSFYLDSFTVTQYDNKSEYNYDKTNLVNWNYSSDYTKSRNEILEQCQNSMNEKSLFLNFLEQKKPFAVLPLHIFKRSEPIKNNFYSISGYNHRKQSDNSIHHNLPEPYSVSKQGAKVNGLTKSNNSYFSFYNELCNYHNKQIQLNKTGDNITSKKSKNLKMFDVYKSKKDPIIIIETPTNSKNGEKRSNGESPNKITCDYMKSIFNPSMNIDNSKESTMHNSKSEFIPNKNTVDREGKFEFKDSNTEKYYIYSDSKSLSQLFSMCSDFNNFSSFIMIRDHNSIFIDKIEVNTMSDIKEKWSTRNNTSLVNKIDTILSKVKDLLKYPKCNSNKSSQKSILRHRHRFNINIKETKSSEHYKDSFQEAFMMCLDRYLSSSLLFENEKINTCNQFSLGNYILTISNKSNVKVDPSTKQLFLVFFNLVPTTNKEDALKTFFEALFCKISNILMVSYCNSEENLNIINISLKTPFEFIQSFDNFITNEFITNQSLSFLTNLLNICSIPKKCYFLYHKMENDGYNIYSFDDIYRCMVKSQFTTVVLQSYLFSMYIQNLSEKRKNARLMYKKPKSIKTYSLIPISIAKQYFLTYFIIAYNFSNFFSISNCKGQCLRSKMIQQAKCIFNLDQNAEYENSLLFYILIGYYYQSIMYHYYKLFFKKTQKNSIFTTLFKTNISIDQIQMHCNMTSLSLFKICLQNCTEFISMAYFITKMELTNLQIFIIHDYLTNILIVLTHLLFEQQLHLAYLSNIDELTYNYEVYPKKNDNSDNNTSNSKTKKKKKHIFNSLKFLQKRVFSIDGASSIENKYLSIYWIYLGFFLYTLYLLQNIFFIFYNKFPKSIKYENTHCGDDSIKYNTGLHLIGIKILDFISSFNFKEDVKNKSKKNKKNTKSESNLYRFFNIDQHCFKFVMSCYACRIYKYNEINSTVRIPNKLANQQTKNILKMFIYTHYLISDWLTTLNPVFKILQQIDKKIKNRKKEFDDINIFDGNSSYLFLRELQGTLFNIIFFKKLRKFYHLTLKQSLICQKINFLSNIQFLAKSFSFLQKIYSNTLVSNNIKDITILKMNNSQTCNNLLTIFVQYTKIISMQMISIFYKRNYSKINLNFFYNTSAFSLVNISEVLLNEHFLMLPSLKYTFRYQNTKQYCICNFSELSFLLTIFSFFLFHRSKLLYMKYKLASIFIQRLPFYIDTGESEENTKFMRKLWISFIFSYKLMIILTSERVSSYQLISAIGSWISDLFPKQLFLKLHKNEENKNFIMFRSLSFTNLINFILSKSLYSLESLDSKKIDFNRDINLILNFIPFDNLTLSKGIKNHQRK